MKDKVIVIKYGSGSVSGEQGMDLTRLRKYASNLAGLSRSYRIILVCSGSVSVGKSIWSKRNNGKAADAKVLAMLGSAAAFSAWQEALSAHGILAGQLLVTHREVDDIREGPNLLAAIQANNAAGVITIINENDALSDIELAKLSYGGDNDGLAAHIALSVSADALVMLTNVDGLIRNGKVVKKVGANTKAWSKAMSNADASVSSLGRGGMISKIEAAIRASRAGIRAHIASADADLEQVTAGNKGTYFVAK